MGSGMSTNEPTLPEDGEGRKPCISPAPQQTPVVEEPHPGILGPLAIAAAILFGVLLLISYLGMTVYQMVEKRRADEIARVEDEQRMLEQLKQQEAARRKKIAAERLEQKKLEEEQRRLAAEVQRKLAEKKERERAAQKKRAREEREERNRELMAKRKAELERKAEVEAKRAADAALARARAKSAKEFDALVSTIETIHTKLTTHIQKTNRTDARIDLGDGRGEGLAWRVHLLPLLGQEELYSKFRLNEPWDSEHNKKLVAAMPSVFSSGVEQGKTRIRSVANIDGPLANRVRQQDYTDGINQTALLFLVNEDSATPWTKPDTIDDAFHRGRTAAVTFADKPTCFTIWGKDKAVLRSLTPDFFNAITTPAGGEHIDIRQVTRTHSKLDEAVAFRSEPVPPPTMEGDETLARQSMPQLAEALIGLARDLNAGRVSPSPLSWRVHVLPYLGYHELYKRFDLAGDWANEQNRQLIGQMPAIFGDAATGRSRVMLSNGASRMASSMTSLVRMTDKPEQTGLLFMSAPHKAVTWTMAVQPTSFSRTRRAQPKPTFHSQLGWHNGDPLFVGMVSGDVVSLPDGLHSSKLAALLTMNGSETFLTKAILSDPKSPLSPEATAPNPLTDPGRVPNERPGQNDRQESDIAVQEQVMKLAKAMDRYHSVYRRSPGLPVRGTVNNLSWRVKILPYIGQTTLYEQFAHDEPWDSETNKALLDQMPAVFSFDPDETSTTSIQILTGKQSLLQYGMHPYRAPDGSANSISLVRVGPSRRVQWTKPDDNAVDPWLKLEDLAGSQGYLDVLTGLSMCNWMRLPRDTPNSLFLAMATGTGREVVDAQTVGRWCAHTQGLRFVPAETEQDWEAQQLQKLMFALHNYQDKFRTMPPDWGRHRNSKTAPIPERNKQLSWRVHLLPMLGHGRLFSKFKLDESWDSPHNKQLLGSMPDVYRDVAASTGSTETRIMMPVGRGAMIKEVGRTRSLRDTPDGSHSTIAVIQAPRSKSVPWTKPEDFNINLKTGEGIKLLVKRGMLLGLCSGTVRRLPPGFDQGTIKALITPNGGEVINMRDVFGK